MAFTRNNLQALFALFFIVVMALSGGAMAAADCNNVNFDLSACNDYFTPDNATVFIQNCCGDLSNVAKTYTSCVCDAIDTLSSADKSNIVTAFTVCNISACNIGTGGSTDTSTSTPATPSISTSPSTPSISTTPSTPSTSNGGIGNKSFGNAGNLDKPFHLGTLILFVVSMASVVINF
ncbi:hypothetical protein M9H77_01473 [Catharanthus roseus]|uniref:Uncharacterized protein n=1 Tax=Catharanthus roseus TaxID=4058 RepID=A0ACC0C633_CATRO|nr:hypothetical protein M9H77_01473 [Catharanthus roseus]